MTKAGQDMTGQSRASHKSVPSAILVELNRSQYLAALSKEDAGQLVLVICDAVVVSWKEGISMLFETDTDFAP